MERAIKSYDPDRPDDPITKTFDAIQNQVSFSKNNIQLCSGYLAITE